MTELTESPVLERKIATEEGMLEFGAALASALSPGCIVFLQGDLGVGKTTLCRGIIEGMGISGRVKSPTYTLVEPYDAGGQPVFHFDLYRLGDPEELEFLGYRDYFDDEGICLIEWPERGRGMLPTPDLTVRIVATAETRTLSLESDGTKGDIIINQL